MTKDLLWRGMLAGILAALLATLFARAVAEPQVDRAVAYEAAHDATAPANGHDHDGDASISRATQKGAGLATAVILYGAAIGGIFSLVFAYCHGRVGAIGPRTLALTMAALGFVAIVVVPGLKYPPNPPAVGKLETIQLRTAAYFAMLAVSIAALALSARVRALMRPRSSAFDAMLVAGIAYAVVVAIAQTRLPNIDEVPADFPAAVLWNFRIASIAMQVVLWATMGIVFGWMAEQRMKSSPAR